MNRLALIAIIALASASAWAAAPILETDGPANKNLTSEVAIGSYTASANTEVIAQVRLISGLTATAANISLRLAQTSAADVELAGYVDGVARAKNAVANTYYGCRNLGGNGFVLLTGEKAVVYALSSNAGDTVVSCQVDWIDALALPTGAATSTSIGTPVALDGGAATIGGMLAKMADDGGGADFDAATDSLEKKLTGLIFASTMVGVGELLGTPAQAGEAASAATTVTNFLTANTMQYARIGDPMAILYDERLTVTLANASAGETWTLFVGSEETIPLGYNSTALLVELAIEDQYTGSGAIEVSGASGGPYTVIFSLSPYPVITGGTCTGNLTVTITNDYAYESQVRGADIYSFAYDSAASTTSTIASAITASQSVVAALVWTQLLSTLDDTENTIGHKLYNFLVTGRTGGTGT